MSSNELMSQGDIFPKKTTTISESSEKVQKLEFSYNGKQFSYDIDYEMKQGFELKVLASPFKPVYFSNTEHLSNYGRNVRSLDNQIYFVHQYDQSSFQGIVGEDEETGEQLEGWFKNDDHEYSIVITNPDLIDINSFTLEDQALFRLAQKVRATTGQEMTTDWKIRVVNDPEIFNEAPERIISTPANTSKVRWSDQKIDDSILLRCIDGWTGNRDETSRLLLVLDSEWPEFKSNTK